jgi:hypothetical protein
VYTNANAALARGDKKEATRIFAFVLFLDFSFQGMLDTQSQAQENYWSDKQHSGPPSDLLKLILSTEFSPQAWFDREISVVANTDKVDETSAWNAALFHLFYARTDRACRFIRWA